jgi:hypothetical protein
MPGAWLAGKAVTEYGPALNGSKGWILMNFQIESLLRFRRQKTELR